MSGFCSQQAALLLQKPNEACLVNKEPRFGDLVSSATYHTQPEQVTFMSEPGMAEETMVTAARAVVRLCNARHEVINTCYLLSLHPWLYYPCCLSSLATEDLDRQHGSPFSTGCC